MFLRSVTNSLTNYKLYLCGIIDLHYFLDVKRLDYLFVHVIETNFIQFFHYVGKLTFSY